MKKLQTNWKSVFKKDIESKLKYAEIEFKEYKRTGYIIYLQQSCNKLFSAVENYMMLKYNIRVKSYQELKQIVINNKNDKVLLAQVSQLHYFFYNGDLQMDRDEAEILYIDIKNKLKNRLK
jgi:hypothetical protein